MRARRCSSIASRVTSLPVRRTATSSGRSCQRGWGNGDHRRLGDAGMIEGRCLRCDAGNPFAARLDDVLRAIDDVEAAVAWMRAMSAGRQPQPPGSLSCYQISCCDDVAARLQVAGKPRQSAAGPRPRRRRCAVRYRRRCGPTQRVLDLLCRGSVGQSGRQRRLARAQCLGHAPALRGLRRRGGPSRASTRGRAAAWSRPPGQRAAIRSAVPCRPCSRAKSAHTVGTAAASVTCSAAISS